MKRTGRQLAAWLLAGALAATTGCAAMRRPETRPPAPGAPAPTAPTPAPAPTTPTAPAPAAPGQSTPAPGSDAARAQALAALATQVPGVRGAWVVAVGTTAYAGVDLHGEAVRQPGPNGSIEAQVAAALERSPHNISRAYVSTKPELVQSIQVIALSLQQGRPLSQLAAEISKLTAEMAPATSP